MTDTKHCAIVPARMERVTLKSGWFVTRWRVIDMQDNDLLQPWFKCNSEAKRIAIQMGYTIV